MEIVLKPVTDENMEAVLSLKVAKGQEGFIETPAACMKEAKECSNWRPFGIYVKNSLGKEALAGFAMYGYFENHGKNGRLWMDRLLIDKSYQGKGYGKKALSMLLERLQREYSCNEIYLSVYDNNPVAIRMYESFGFAFNGEKDTLGEDIMVLKLKG